MCTDEFDDEPNEDDVDEDLTVDEIEKKLDKKILKYEKFNENEHNPMKGVSYLSGKKTWRFRPKKESKKKEVTNQSLDVIVGEAIKNSLPENSKVFSELKMKWFPYQKHFFISYWDNNEIYFDIQHIISVLNLKEASWSKKYKKFKSTIIGYKWHKNEFGGYICRGLINETTMYELVLSSNCPLSKVFKKDVANILTRLRKAGKLEITNDAIIMNHDVPDQNSIVNYFPEKNFIVNDKILRRADVKIYDSQSIDDVTIVQKLIDNAPLWLLGKCLKNMYCMPC